MFRSGRYSYDDDQVGYYPPLRAGENIAWAVEVDVSDPALRLECPQIARMDVINVGSWWYPTGLPTFADSPSYEEYVRRMGLGAGVHPGMATPIDSGRAVVWSEEHGHWFWRETTNTPYGWYTFDTGTMSARKVDTDPGSWDTENLWGFGPRGLSMGWLWYPAGTTVEVILSNPWSAFDPWMEVVLPGESATRPGLATSMEGLNPYSGYIRVTCGVSR